MVSDAKFKEQPKKKPKQKPTKPRGYSEEQDNFLYNTHQDEREAAEVTNFRWTSDSESYF